MADQHNQTQPPRTGKSRAGMGIAVVALVAVVVVLAFVLFGGAYDDGTDVDVTVEDGPGSEVELVEEGETTSGADAGTEPAADPDTETEAGAGDAN